MARRSGVVAALVRMQREAERQRVRQARAAAQSQRAAAAARNTRGRAGPETQGPHVRGGQDAGGC